MASAAGSPRKAAATSPKAEVQSLETGSVFSDQTSVQLLEVGDVVCLRAEAISEKEMKSITILQGLGEVVAVAALIVDVILKYVMTSYTYLRSDVQLWVNIVPLAVCIIALTSILCVFCSRTLQHRKALWGRRRKIPVISALLEAILVLISMIGTFIPNAYNLIRYCSWFHTITSVCIFVAWSCWNCLFMIFVINARNIGFWKHRGQVLVKDGRELTMMEAPLIKHAWVWIQWTFFECVVIAMLVLENLKTGPPFQSASDHCRARDFVCKLPPGLLVVILHLLAAWAIWIALWMGSIYFALTELQKRSWQKYKLANVALRVEIRSRLTCVVIFALSICLLMLLRFNTCPSILQVWQGLTPMAAVLTVMSMSTLYFNMPTSRGLLNPIVQGMLQQHAWSEEQKPARLEQRNQRLTELGQDAICGQPLFCVETAIKLFYFSALIYVYKEEAAQSAEIGSNEPTVQGYTLPKAMGLYNLEAFELLYEPAEDTKVLLCWNRDMIVITFRGTASFTNALADIQVWLAPHHASEHPLSNRPRVHAGFLRSWVANGLHERVMGRIGEILKSPGVDVGSMQILLTGHSLGGALSTLAAYDVALELQDLLSLEQVSCYTYGAPRTGSHAFAKNYNVAVPDTWHVINARDIVPRTGKLLRSYKRPGQRVVTNQLGDMLVRPSFAEISVFKSVLPLQLGLRDHFLVSYQASLLSICNAQFTGKAQRTGIEGMRSLLASGHVHEVLSDNNLREGAFAKLAARGGGTILQLSSGLQGLRQGFFYKGNERTLTADATGNISLVDASMPVEEPGDSLAGGIQPPQSRPKLLQRKPSSLTKESVQGGEADVKSHAIGLPTDNPPERDVSPKKKGLEVSRRSKVEAPLSPFDVPSIPEASSVSSLSTMTSLSDRGKSEGVSVHPDRKLLQHFSLDERLQITEELNLDVDMLHDVLNPGSVPGDSNV